MKEDKTENVPGRGEIAELRKKILRWFAGEGRQYPWRETDDAFRVLIAEMMLRRTRADQVEGVYDKLFEKYPDVKTLAAARADHLKKILRSLGLAWRLPAFRAVAREIRDRHAGRVPKKREELVQLTGVGEYVAGATLSIAYGEREWIVDSNVVRLFKRYFGIRTSKEGRRDAHVIKIARLYASGNKPREANLGLLDFTALVCVPGRPRCERCPLRKKCAFYTEQKFVSK